MQVVEVDCGLCFFNNYCLSAIKQGGETTAALV